MPRINRAPALWTALVAALSAGCASPPVPTPPAALGSASVAAAWQAPLPHGGVAADLATWWQQFNDPALPALQAAAQGASPTLASARARMERARAARVAAGAALLPQVDAVASAISTTSSNGADTINSIHRPSCPAPRTCCASIGLAGLGDERGGQ